MNYYLSSGAVLSDCGRYRYLLWRVWDSPLIADAPVVLPPRKAVVAFCGLNPSTADATQDDPTIRRCVGFAKSWGYAGLLMVNRFAWRSTDPRGMDFVEDAYGPGNKEWMRTALDCSDIFVAAWGATLGPTNRNSPAILASILKGLAPEKLRHLGLTKDGHPRHPLYLRGDTQPQRWTL